MSANVQKKSIGDSIPTFNLIAMKDIKDKTTRKGSLRPLFDCVDSFAASVDSLHDFMRSNPDDADAGTIQQFLDHLTQMQVKLLEMCKQRVQDQNRFDPLDAVSAEGEASAAIEANPAAPQQAAMVRPVAKR